MVESTHETESDLHNIPQILKDTTCESTPPEMVQSAKQDHDELQRKGSIHLFLGPVYSEKTARLLAEITYYYSSCGSISNKCVLVTNQKAFLDINLIPSSNETFSRLECLELQEKLDTLKHYDVIAINEGQLFSDIVEICEQLANRRKNNSSCSVGWNLPKRASKSFLNSPRSRGITVFLLFLSLLLRLISHFKFFSFTLFLNPIAVCIRYKQTEFQILGPWTQYRRHVS